MLVLAGIKTGNEQVIFHIVNIGEKYEELAIISKTHMEVCWALRSGVHIQGIVFDNGKLVGTNGTLERYTNRRFTVIATVGEDKVVYFDKMGMSCGVSSMAAFAAVSEQSGISNGRLAGQHDGKRVVAPIKGNYRKLEEGKFYADSRDYKSRTNEKRDSGDKEQSQKQTEAFDVRGGYLGRVEGKGNNRARTVHKVKVLDGVVEYSQVNNYDFHKGITEAKRLHPYGAAVDAHTIADYAKMSCLQLDDGKSGVAVGEDGYITSLYKHPNCREKGVARKALTMAVKHGGYKMDCYGTDDALPELYSKCGFIPVCKIKFNREYAPEGWNFETQGEPDIVFFIHCGDSLNSMNNKSYKSYLDYTEAEVPYIESSGTKSDYELASEYRDRLWEDRAKALREKKRAEEVNKTLGMMGIKLK